jgi:hypothetical protein
MTREITMLFVVELNFSRIADWEKLHNSQGKQVHCYRICKHIVMTVNTMYVINMTVLKEWSVNFVLCYLKTNAVYVLPVFTAIKY